MQILDLRKKEEAKANVAEYAGGLFIVLTMLLASFYALPMIAAAAYA